MMRHWSDQECQDEVSYIKSVDPQRPGSSFKDSPETFARYCNMQANTIEASGYALIAEEVRQVRDIAMPDFVDLNTAKALSDGVFLIGKPRTRLTIVADVNGARFGYPSSHGLADDDHLTMG